MSICGAGANVAEKFAPHYRPSYKSHYSNSAQGMPTMSLTKESYDSYVQIVKNIVRTELISNVVTKLPAISAGVTEDITTRLEWTPACDELLQFYRTEVHPKVDLETGAKDVSADFMSQGP